MISSILVRIKFQGQRFYFALLASVSGNFKSKVISCFRDFFTIGTFVTQLNITFFVLI